MLSAVVALSSVSCLDKYPSDAMTFGRSIQSVDDVNLAMIGIYDAFKSSYLYSGALTLLPDIQTDLVYGINNNTNVYGEVWRWNDILSTNTDIEGVYGSLYDVINRCNFLLDRVDEVRAKTTDDDQLDKLDQCCGEAYFARALAYSELIKLFCKPYEKDRDMTQELGVILTEHYQGDEPMRRADLKSSYEFVIKDLERAAELLEVEDDYTGGLYDLEYFCEYTVYALRARIALYMQDWDAAVEYSSKVIDSKYYALSSASQLATSSQSYYQYMWSNDTSTEIIWKVAFTINSYGGALGTVFANYDMVSYRPDYVPANWVLNLYDLNDLRYDAFFKTMTTGYSHGLTCPLLIKYFGNEQFMSYRIYHVTMPKVFRLSEQYLIRAEAYAMKKDYSSASDDISTLLSARYSSSSVNVSLSEENAMDIIEEERVKELYMEGFRLNDLKRWHKGFEREPQEQSLSNGSSLKVEADDPLFVWPIPQHELDSPGADVQPNESNK